MPWTYVLRARERWLSSSDASNSREEQATRTLKGFGLKEAVGPDLLSTYRLRSG